MNDVNISELPHCGSVVTGWLIKLISVGMNGLKVFGVRNRFLLDISQMKLVGVSFNLTVMMTRNK